MHWTLCFRYGSCELYWGSSWACNEFFEPGVDYIFISSSEPDQNAISTSLDSAILQSNLNIRDTCSQSVLRTLCISTFKPCGSKSLGVLHLPGIYCPDQCSQIKESCPEQWKLLSDILTDTELLFNSFDCNATQSAEDTLPSCCTDSQQCKQESSLN